jgi:hypothetical protein
MLSAFRVVLVTTEGVDRVATAGVVERVTTAGLVERLVCALDQLASTHLTAVKHSFVVSEYLQAPIRVNFISISIAF